MRYAREWKLVIVAIIISAAFADISQSKEPNDLSGRLTGEVRYQYQYIGVNGDRGRFREDNWMTDRSTGGIDWLHLENVKPAKNDYKVTLEGRALHDYDYDLSLLLRKPKDHYLKFDFSGLRRYYDGSNEFWDASVKKLAELPDNGFFVDRRNYNIELGLTPPDKPQFIIGWHRLEKDGKEALLRGSTGQDRAGREIRGVPDVINMKGITDTFYGEVAHTFDKKYNFRIRQEFEQFHDKQSGPLERVFDDAGNLIENNRFVDNLGFTNWRTMFLFDTFLDNKTYVTANYMYNYLRNDSARTNFQPDLNLKETSAGNNKRTNVAGIGYRRADALGIPNLDLSAGIRIEDSKTDAESSWFFEGVNFFTRSTLDEVRVAEALRLIYKGIKQTTLSFDAKLEQRDLGWDADDTFDPAKFTRKTDIDFLDQVYILKAVHRFNPSVKSTVSLKYKNLERSQTNLFRENPAANEYPGFLGDHRITGGNFLAKTDFRLNNQSAASLLYEFIQESFNFEVGGKTSNQEIHRGAGNLSFSPVQNAVIVSTFMLENRVLDTPVNAAPGTEIAPGPRPFDFKGNSYSLLLDGTYAFNENTSCTLGLRHTEALGTVDDAGDYIYDKVGITLKHKLAVNKTIGLGYAFYNFNNHRGDDFDDYQAHGVIVTYDYKF